MIIFTVTNQTSGQMYVGYTRNNLQEQWQKIVSAAEDNIDFPLYREIRSHGVENFTVDEYDYAETREEVKEVEKEIIQFYNAKSLRGYKTSNLIIKKKPRRSTNAKKENKTLKKLFTVDPMTDPDIDDSFVLEQSDTTLSHGSDSSENNKIVRVIKRNSKTNMNSEKQPDTASLESHSTTIKTEFASLDSHIDNQPSAIQAAANALLSGDTQAVHCLTEVQKMVVPPDREFYSTTLQEGIDLQENTASQEGIGISSKDSYLQIFSVVLTPFQQKITAAVERHRSKMAARTNSETRALRKKLQKQLSDIIEKSKQLKA